MRRFQWILGRRLSSGSAWFRNGKKTLNFECTMCGKCCSNNRIDAKYINSAELEAISSHLSIDKQRFFRDYIVETENADGSILLGIKNKTGELSHQCVFLDSATRHCTIHQVKPHVCEAYPFVAATLIGESEWSNEALYCEGISVTPSSSSSSSSSSKNEAVNLDDVMRKLILLSIHSNGVPADPSLEQTYTEALTNLKKCEESGDRDSDMLGDFESEFFSLNRSEVVYDKGGLRVIDSYIANGDCSDAYRRLEFASSTNFSQSEVALTGQSKADHSHLIAPFNKVLASVVKSSLVGNSNSSCSGTSKRVLVLGAGACVLPMYLLATRGSYDVYIDAVEIERDLFAVAKEYFDADIADEHGTIEDVVNKIRPITIDAIDFISQLDTKRHGLYDAVILDIFNGGSTAPPKSFLNQSLTESLLTLIAPERMSVIAVNVYGDPAWLELVRSSFTDSLKSSLNYKDSTIRVFFVGDSVHYGKSGKTGNYILCISNRDVDFNIDDVVSDYTTLIK